MASVVIVSIQLGAPARVLSTSVPGDAFPSHTSNWAPLGSKQTAIRPLSMTSKAGKDFPPSDVTFSPVASALSTFTMTPMCAGSPWRRIGTGEVPQSADVSPADLHDVAHAGHLDVSPTKQLAVEFTRLGRAWASAY